MAHDTGPWWALVNVVMHYVKEPLAVGHGAEALQYFIIKDELW
jgi:hypothetical protein